MTAKKLLVVDDEEGVRSYFQHLFPSPEYEMHGAAGGREALEKIKADGFDMLILDLVMPDMDGMEVLRRVREIRPEILVLIITGYPSKETAEEAVSRGCVDYVQKPFETEEIKKLVYGAFEAQESRLRHARLYKQA